MKLHSTLKVILGIVATSVVWLLVVKPVKRAIFGFEEVQWMGETFKLKQKYLDYEEYSKASDQLAVQETERAKRSMLAAKVPVNAKSHRDLTWDLREMRFPGYGSIYNGAVKDESGNRFVLFEYELPQLHQQRALLYRIQNDGSHKLVVDGISVDRQSDHLLGNIEVKVENRILKYSSQGKVYHEIPFASER